MGKKVLVVDDERLIVKGIKFSLVQDDMEVDCAYDGEEALEMVKRKEYDMILLDVMLHFRCSRRSQRYQRGFSYFIDNGTDAAILRTEVMTPFRNTMGFVHGIERNLHRFQKLHILFLRQ